MAIAHANIGALLKQHGYTEVRKVGEGSFGKAILVQGRDSSRLICKMVDVSKASRKEMQDAIKESQLLAELRHPYIVRYRESFTDNGWLCILMDFCEGGDLTKQIEEARRRRQPIEEERVLKWLAQGVLALKYIHDKHILHRDLKPSNFFLSKSGSMKMGDFGIAKVLACTIAVARTQIGTPYYLSPELCQEKPYAWPSDIWAMGCILYELCALKVPFDAPSIAGLVQKIIKGPIPGVPSAYSPFTAQLCGEMLSRNPDARPGPADILERPRIKAIVEAMQGEEEDGPVEPPGAAPPPPAGAGGAGPYQANAGRYSQGDSVEFYSNSHGDWLPATVTKVDDDHSIVIDLKPNTWITQAEQAARVRPRFRGGGAGDRAPSPSPMLHRSPSAGPGGRATPRGAAAASPMRQRSPSVGGGIGGGGGARPASRGASPAPMLHRSPSCGPGDRPGSSRASASPMRTPSIGSAAPGCGLYRRGDPVEFYSVSHGDWLPAVVSSVDAEGRIVIDLKPNTWLSREEQAARVRPRGRGGVMDRPSSRGAAPLMQRSPSGGAFGAPRAQTPSRAASPRRSVSREPLSRAESPLRRPWEVQAGVGTPRIRPPGLPSGIPPARVLESPLRQGGRYIAGA